jgi:hypothetical protein
MTAYKVVPKLSMMRIIWAIMHCCKLVICWCTHTRRLHLFPVHERTFHLRTCSAKCHVRIVYFFFAYFCYQLCERCSDQSLYEYAYAQQRRQDKHFGTETQKRKVERHLQLIFNCNLQMRPCARLTVSP